MSQRMLLAAPAVEQLPPGLPLLASTQVKPLRSGVCTTTDWPFRNCAVRVARLPTTCFAFAHETPFVTMIHWWPEALKIPQLADARALVAPAVSASARSAAQSASTAGQLLCLPFRTSRAA